MHTKQRQSVTSGFTLIEILLSTLLFSIFMVGFVSVLIYMLKVSLISGDYEEAVVLAEEGLEATLSIRDENYPLLIDGTYGLTIAQGKWAFTNTADIIDGFTREIIIEEVDASTRMVTSRVTWENLGRNGSIELVTYMSDWVTALGEEPGGTEGGKENWCNPGLSVETLDLPKNGIALALTAIEGRAFAGTGENASGISLANVIISNTDPPDATIEGTVNGYKTNDVFGDEDFMYIGTDTNNKEVTIISRATFSEIGHFDASGQEDTQAVFVVGNIGYMIHGSYLRLFNLASKTGARPEIDSISTNGIGTNLFVVGGYVYVTLSGSTDELRIIDVSNPNDIVSVGQADLGSMPGVDIHVNPSGTRAYVATVNSTAEPEFYIVDISSKSGNRSVIGTYDTQEMDPKGVRIFPGSIGIIVGHGGQEYQVMDIEDETNIIECGFVEVDSGINAVDAIVESDNDAYAYILTRNSDSEFQIVEGGSGGSSGGSGGTGSGEGGVLILRRD